jgi:hypothetical protein
VEPKKCRKRWCRMKNSPNNVVSGGLLIAASDDNNIMMSICFITYFKLDNNKDRGVCLGMTRYPHDTPPLP